MTRGFTTFVCVVTMAGLGFAGCGGASNDVVILNTQKVEKAIQQAALSQRGIKVTVDCPSGVHQKEGLTFNCVARGDGGNTTFTVKQTDDDGDVTFTAG